MAECILLHEQGIFIPQSEEEINVEQILALKRGDILPECTFGVYESVHEDKLVFEAISKYAYPPIYPESQRMSVIARGASIVTNRATLYFGPPTKPLKFENVNGHIKRNGVRIPLWLALGGNPLGVK